MNTVICRDYLGKEYTVKQSDLVKRKSAYGVYIVEKQILLIKEKHVDRWEFPGGGIESGENDAEALQREFAEETGLVIDTNISLITRTHEFYYNLDSNEPWDSTRSFYLVTKILSGSLLTAGNHDDTLAAKVVSLPDMLDEEKSLLIPLYRQIAEQAAKIL